MKTFEGMKQAFTIEPVLVKPNLDKELRVEANILDYVTRGMLSIKYEDNKWKYIIFISKSLNKTERNYKIHNKKILVVIQCLEVWRYFLEGVEKNSRFRLIIRTLSIL